MNRREFLENSLKFTKGLGATAVVYCLKPPTLPRKTKETLKPQSFEFSIGINGVPNEQLGVKEIRLPINRAAFDPPRKTKGRSPRSLDAFYLEGERARQLHTHGSRLNLVLELGDGITIDPVNHLEKMFVWANDYFKLREGDKVTIGNEHAILRGLRGYPLEYYIKQFSAITRTIKKFVPGIEIGLQSEAWHGNGDYFGLLVSEFKRRELSFDFVSINFYGSIGQIRERISLYREILTSLGYEVPIEISEVGVRVSDKPKEEKLTYPGQVIVDQDGQADFIAKALSLALSMQARCTYWFNFQDDPENLHSPHYGIVDARGHPRKGLRALGFLSNLLNHATPVNSEATSSYTCLVLTKDDGILVNILWANSGQEVLFFYPENSVVFNALGEKVKPYQRRIDERFSSVFHLPKSSSPNGGSVRIFVKSLPSHSP